MKKFTSVFLVLLLGISYRVCAGAPVMGNWSNVPIFNQAPLEIKLGTFTDGPDPDLLAMVLWNDGSRNRLDAIKIPPPYDGSNTTSTSLESTATLFALGDICSNGGTIVVPYIKNFNIEVARYNGVSWSKSTIPATASNDFDSADCGVTQNGNFISGHDMNDSEIEIFINLSNSNNFNFYGRYGGVSAPVAGPFDGAVRDTLAMDRNGSFGLSFYQRSNGLTRTATFDTSDNPPMFNHNDVQQLIPPVGFVFVKESFGIRILGGVVIGYNADGNARTAEIPDSNPSSPTLRNLGAINNGTQFTFQGGSYIPNIDEEDTLVEHNVIWGDWFIFDPFSAKPANIDVNFPLMGVGGPLSACIRRMSSGKTFSYLAGPRVGSDGTDLHIRELETDIIFTDGFESGDVSVWSNCP